jgi:ABC-type lipoprotein release transport system permease subunit
MFVKLAWRNLWRNKRRTIISISSVAFAVLFSAVISSFQKGTWDHMIDNVVRYYLGYIQVHQKGFWDDKTLENTMALEDIPAEALNDPNIIPRIESFALASSGDITKGVLVIGVDPERERSLSSLDERVVEGRYLNAGDQGVMLAEGLAEHLKLKLGDTLILISQGYQGQNAAGAYPIEAIIKFGAPDLNKQLVVMPLSLAQYFYGTGERYTSLVVNLPNGRDDLEEALTRMKKTFPEDRFEVMDYRDLMPELIEAQKLDTAGAKLILWVLYALIGAGLFGTILMMTRERTYEFGVMLAIGTHRSTLGAMLWFESVLIGLVGAGAGILLSWPIVWRLYSTPIQLSGKMAEAYEQFGIEPIMKAACEFGIFFAQAEVIFIISSILSLYSVWYVMKLVPVRAMRE